MSLIGEALESSALLVMCEYDTEGMDPKERDRLIVYHHYLARGCKLQEYQFTEEVKKIRSELKKSVSEPVKKWFKTKED